MSDPVMFAADYLDRLAKVLRALPLAPIAQVLELLAAARHQKRTVFIAGNGGSAATASHMANDLIWGISRTDGGLSAIALADSLPLLTAVANDAGYAEIFVPALKALASPGDILLAISASGNSAHILRAITVAKEKGIKTIAFLGMGGGKAAAMVDIAVIVPSDDYGPIEDVHMALDHLITAYLRG